MDTQEEQIKKAKQAILHVLKRIKTDERIAFQMGFGTQSFALLTEAAASLFDEPVEKVRDHYSA